MPSRSSCPDATPGNSPTIVPAACVPISSERPPAPWSVPKPFSLRTAAELAPDVHEHAVGEPARLEVGLEGGQRPRQQRDVVGQRRALVVVRVIAAVAVEATHWTGSPSSSMSASAARRRGNVVRGRVGDARVRQRVAALHRPASCVRRVVVIRVAARAAPSSASPVASVPSSPKRAHQLARQARVPDVARPEVVVLRRADGGDRHGRGGQRRSQRVVQRQPLQRIVRRRRGGPGSAPSSRSGRRG